MRSDKDEREVVYLPASTALYTAYVSYNPFASMSIQSMRQSIFHIGSYYPLKPWYYLLIDHYPVPVDVVRSPAKGVGFLHKPLVMQSLWLF